MAGLGHEDPAADAPPEQQAPPGDVLAALAMRDLVGQAKGVVRCLTGCDEESAFRLLVKLSVTSECTLEDVAQLVADGAGPGRRLPAYVGVPFARGVQLLRSGGSLDGLRLPATGGRE